jgi:hypothetical protein
MILRDNWNCYLYRIDFPTGKWYGGVSLKKGEKPEKDGYLGSPVTHKSVWGSETPSKTVIAQLFLENPLVEMYLVEEEYLNLMMWKTDSFCLNEHNGGGFGAKACSNGGKAGSQSQIENRIGIHGLTTEERSIAAKETWNGLSEEAQEKMRRAARSKWENLPEERKEAIKKEARERVSREWSEREAEERSQYMKTCIEAAVQKNTCSWEVLTPQGVMINVDNLSKFCRENGLQVSLMNKVSKKERTNHKGFVVRKVDSEKKG